MRKIEQLRTATHEFVSRFLTPCKKREKLTPVPLLKPCVLARCAQRSCMAAHRVVVQRSEAWRSAEGWDVRQERGGDLRLAPTVKHPARDAEMFGGQGLVTV